MLLNLVWSEIEQNCNKGVYLVDIMSYSYLIYVTFENKTRRF